MDGFMDIGHQKGEQDREGEGEVRKEEGGGTPSCLEYYFTGLYKRRFLIQLNILDITFSVVNI